MTALETAVRKSWVRWGTHYAQWTVCSRCREWRYCRARRRDYWLCLDCYDRSC